MTGYIQCSYNFLHSTCMDVNICPYVGVVLIALINVDPLVFQFDSVSFQKRLYFHVTQVQQCNHEMTSPVPYLNRLANRI